MNKERLKQMHFAQLQREIELTREMKKIELEKNGCITDNKNYFFENSTGAPMPVREVMTP